MMEPTIAWLVHFAVLSLIAAVFIWAGVRISGAVGGDYITAVWVSLATILAVEVVRYFFPGGVGSVNGDIVSAVIALLILTAVISMSYDLSFARALFAAVIATIAILVAIFTLPMIGVDTGLVREVGYSI